MPRTWRKSNNGNGANDINRDAALRQAPLRSSRLRDPVGPQQSKEQSANRQAAAHAMADGILTQAEKTLLREFRYRLRPGPTGAYRKAGAELAKASRDRLMLAAAAADTHPNELARRPASRSCTRKSR